MRAHRKLLPLALAASAALVASCIDFSPEAYCERRPEVCNLQVRAIEPTMGFDTGGQDVAVSGRAFELDSTAAVDGESLPVLQITPTRLTIKMPARPSGTQSTVTVRHAYGEASLPNAFLYVRYPFQEILPASVPIPGGTFPTAVEVADFNLDGRPDVVALSNSGSGGNAIIALNLGGFRFQAPRPFDISAGLFRAPTTLVAGDFNRDGKPDVVTGLCCGLAGIVLGNGNGTFGPALEFPRTDNVQAPFGLDAGDFNGDGKLDLASGSDFGVNVLLGNGDGTFQAPVRQIPGNPVRGVYVWDVNADGLLDILTTRWFSSDNRFPLHQITVSLGAGDGTFPITTVINAASTTGGGVEAIYPGDIDSDGKLDLVTTGFSSLGVLFGNGDGTFGTPIQRTFQTTLGEVLIRDYDNDGMKDLLVTNFIPSFENFRPAYALLYGRGNGNFLPPIPFAEETSARAVALVDMNQDGKEDLVSVEAAQMRIFPGR